MNRTAIFLPAAAFAILAAACHDPQQPVEGIAADARETELVALHVMSIDGVRSVVNNLVVVQGS